MVMRCRLLSCCWVGARSLIASKSAAPSKVHTKDEFFLRL